MNGIEPNPNALVCPANSSLKRKDFDYLIAIKKKMGCETWNWAEFIRYKILLPFIKRNKEKYHL